MTECEAILKKKYNIPEEEDLMIIKADFLNEQGLNVTEFLGTETDYQIFSYSLGAFLPLQACKEADAEVTVYNPFNNNHLIYKFQSMIEENITIMKMLIYVKKIVHSLNIIQRQKLIHVGVE